MQEKLNITPRLNSCGTVANADEFVTLLNKLRQNCLIYTDNGLIMYRQIEELLICDLSVEERANLDYYRYLEEQRLNKKLEKSVKSYRSKRER